MKFPATAAYYLAYYKMRDDADDQRLFQPMTTEHMEALRKYAFRPLESFNNISVGWVDPKDPLQAPTFEGMSAPHPYTVLALRIDKWALPAEVVKARVAAETARYMEETGLRRLAKSHRAEIQQHVINELRKQSTPSMKVVFTVVDPERRQLWIFTRSSALRDTVLRLLEETFPMGFVPHNFVARALLTGKLTPLTLRSGAPLMRSTGNEHLDAHWPTIQPHNLWTLQDLPYGEHVSQLGTLFLEEAFNAGGAEVTTDEGTTWDLTFGAAAEFRGEDKQTMRLSACEVSNSRVVDLTLQTFGWSFRSARMTLAMKELEWTFTLGADLAPIGVKVPLTAGSKDEEGFFLEYMGGLQQLEYALTQLLGKFFEESSELSQRSPTES